MSTHDYIVVGSGINSLVCAAMLAKRGRSVLVVERNDRIGGCLRSEELIAPGFKHDVMASWFPLFVTSPAYAQLGHDLLAHGAEFVSIEYPTASVLPNNEAFILTTDRKRNVAAMNERCQGDGNAYHAALGRIEASAELTFAMLGRQLRTFGVAKLFGKLAWRSGLSGLIRFIGDALPSCRAWLMNDIRDPATQACLAAWVLHVGLNPESVLSGQMAKIVALTLESVGVPVVRGGNQVLLDAFENFIVAKGGKIEVSLDVDEVLVNKSGKAIGVRMAGGDTRMALQGVICSVTPTQLYQRLLRNVPLPAAVKEDASRYQYGLGDMQIHLALNAPPKWVNSALSRVGIVHVTGGIDSVSKAVNEGIRGLLPCESTIVVGQPSAVDPTRAPAGSSILWIQILDVPRRIRGDAKEEIATPENGQWTQQIGDQYADRIITLLKRHISNLDTATIGRKVLTPADLAALNINLVGGDPYGGSCGLEQSFLWRPGSASSNNDTPVESLYHIGSSTHPGPGLGGVSGFLVAEQLT